MIKANNYRSLKKKNILAQSYLYITNSILAIVEKENLKYIGITSSILDENKKHLICENICKNICLKNKNVCLITSYVEPEAHNNSGDGDLVSDVSTMKIKDNVLKTIRINNISKEKLRGILSNEKDNNDLIIISIPPTNIFADSLEYAKVCQNVLLMEKYLYTRYNDFENNIYILKQNDINVLGIVTYV